MNNIALWLYKYGLKTGLSLILLVTTWDMILYGVVRGFWEGGVYWKGILLIWLAFGFIIGWAVAERGLDKLTKPKR